MFRGRDRVAKRHFSGLAPSLLSGAATVSHGLPRTWFSTANHVHGQGSEDVDPHSSLMHCSGCRFVRYRLPLRSEVVYVVIDWSSTTWPRSSLRWAEIDLISSSLRCRWRMYADICCCSCADYHRQSACHRRTDYRLRQFVWTSSSMSATNITVISWHSTLLCVELSVGSDAGLRP